MDSSHHADGKQFTSNRFEKYTRTETPRRIPQPVRDRGPNRRTPIRRCAGRRRSDRKTLQGGAPTRQTGRNRAGVRANRHRPSYPAHVFLSVETTETGQPC